MLARNGFHAPLLAIALAGALLAPGRASAQAPPIELPPRNFVLPNYDSIPIGSTGSLEGGAFLARADDDSSNWFNPAGLSRASTSSVSSAAGAYELLTLDANALPEKGSDTQQVPAQLGVLVASPFGGERANASLLLVRTRSFEQVTEAQVDAITNGQGDLFSYTADSTFSQTEGSFGMSYKANGAWRLGAAISGVYTYLSAIQSASRRAVTPDGLSSGQVAGRLTGTLGQGRLTLGTQYDLTSEIRLGAVLRTPGVTVIRNGSSNVDGLYQSGAASASYTFFDSNLRFDYKLPWELAVGAAYAAPKFEVELDVKGYSAISAFDLFRTTQSAIVITDDGSGSPVVAQRPVANVVSASKAIVNVAVGGHLVLSDNRVWKLHFGANTDFSPVASDDTFFDRVNLYALTVGLSGETRHIVGSLGVQYSFGSATVPLASGEPSQTKLDVHSLGILYSLGYRF